MKLFLRVQPNSKKEKFEVSKEGILKLKIRAPAIEGKANERIIDILAQCLGVRKSAIQIIQGFKSKEKLIQIQDIKSIDNLEIFTKATWK